MLRCATLCWVFLLARGRLALVEIPLDKECRNYQPVEFREKGGVPTLRVLYDLVKEERQEEDFTAGTPVLRERCVNLSVANPSGTTSSWSEGLNSPFQLELPFTKPSGERYRFILPVALEEGSTQTAEDALRSIKYELENRSDELGKVGFFEGSDFTSAVLREFSVPAGAFGAPQACPPAARQPSEFYHYDCLLGEGDYDDYFHNLMTYDWALWFAVLLSLAYVFTANFLSHTMVFDERFRDNRRTLHPLYSLHYCGSEVIFTRRSRLTQVFLIISAISFFNALMTTRYVENEDEEDVSLAIRLTVFPLFSVIFAMFPAYLTGVVLNIFYKCHRAYVVNIKNARTTEETKAVMEKYESERYHKIFLYYIIATLLGLFFLAMGTWFLYGLQMENQGWWLLQVVIAIAFDWLVLDVLIVLLAGIRILKKLFKLRGFWFDYDLHEQYMQVEQVK